LLNSAVFYCIPQIQCQFTYREKFYEAKLQQQQRELKQLQEERKKLIEIQEKIQALQKACPDLQVIMNLIIFFSLSGKSENLMSAESNLCILLVLRTNLYLLILCFMKWIK
jgi:uncharacterized membrane protein (DUF106 family)